MREIKLIRRENLERLNAKYKSQAAFADAVNLSSARLNHLLTGERNLGEKAARKIEEALKIPYGTLDIDTSAIDGTVVRKEISNTVNLADIPGLLPLASPGTQEILRILEQGLEEDKLNQKDIELLETIAKRLINDKNRTDS